MYNNGYVDQILDECVCFRLGKHVCYETASLSEQRKASNKEVSFRVANGSCEEKLSDTPNSSKTGFNKTGVALCN